MSFWNKLRLAGGLLVLVVAALTACAAMLLEPDAWPSDPEPAQRAPPACSLGPACSGL
jgi:hypothetical protein